MKFYVVDEFPQGPAETCMSVANGTERGDAPRCPKCGECVGSLVWLPPLRAELELVGKQFGDFAFAAGDDLPVSESFAQLYHRHKLTGLSGFDPIEVVKVTSRRKKRPDPPPYVRTIVSYGRTAIDLAASGFEWLEPPTCTECRSGIIVRWQRVIIEDGTWTGDDVFTARGLPGTIIVSERFKDVCEQNGVTNAVFLPAESYGHDFYPGMKDPSELDFQSE